MLSNLDEFMTPEAVSTPLTQKPASSEIRREPLGTLLVRASCVLSTAQ